MTKDEQEEKYRKIWNAKTSRQVQREINDWHKHMNKHNAGYNWHLTNPDSLSDGDRVMILKEILSIKLDNKHNVTQTKTNAGT